MDSFFWWSGATLWFIVAALILIALLLFLWALTGAFLFGLKARRYVKNEKRKDNASWVQVLGFTWQRTWDGTPYVQFIDGDRVYRPWPWLSKRHRKELEEDLHLPA